MTEPTQPAVTSSGSSSSMISEDSVSLSSSSVSSEVPPASLPGGAPTEKAGFTVGRTLNFGGNVTDVTGFDEFGFARVKIDGYWALVNDQGEFVTAPVYNSINFFFEDYAVVDRNGKFGYIDMNGTEVIKPTYTNAFSFRDGMALAKNDDSWHLLEKPGESLGVSFALPTEGPMVNMGENIVAINKNGTYSCVNVITGKTIAFSGESGHFTDGLAPILDPFSKRWYYIDTDGNNAGIGEYDKAGDFNIYGNAIVEQNGKKFLIGTEGHRLTDIVDDIWNSTSEGWVTVMIDDKYGYCNTKTDETIDADYEDCYAFSGGLAPVKYQGDWYLLDEDGNTERLINYHCQEIFKFFDGIAKIQTDGMYTFVDTEGMPVLHEVYEDALFYGGGFIPVKQNGFWSFVEVTPN